MRNLTTMLKVVFLTVALTALVACGKANGNAPNIDPSTGKHPAGWAVANTGGAHPAAFIANPGLCVECHGSATDANTSGGISGVSCFSQSFGGISCHPSGPGSAPHSVPFPSHAATASSNFNFCLGCHQVAANAAGSIPPGCQNCHLTDPTVPGLVPCASCHANPPAGTTYPNFAGTHSPHINASKVTIMALVCADCHNNLGVGTLDHLNRSRARTITGRANPVVFSSGTLLVAGGGTASSFNDTTAQCANVYCHGAKMPGGDTTGTNRSPTWGTTLLTATISAAACGTCHGFPPSIASGHPSITVPANFPATPLGATCSCHANINTQTATATTYANVFLDKTKHINGTLEVGAPHSIPLPIGGYPGSSHKSFSNGTGCIGCHQLGTSASIYPVPSGTAPNCRACHLNNSPSTDPHCSDCHGSVANNGAGATLAGRPSGGTFPNTLGQHNVSNHLNYTCDVCHSITETSPSHGWSGGTKSTFAQIKIGLITSWNQAAGQCTAACHSPVTDIRTWQ